MNDCDALPDYTGYLHAISCDDGDAGGGDCAGLDIAWCYPEWWLAHDTGIFSDDTGWLLVCRYDLSFEEDNDVLLGERDCQGDHND